jgi:hypothetical protein
MAKKNAILSKHGANKEIKLEVPKIHFDLCFNIWKLVLLCHSKWVIKLAISHALH